MTYGVWTEARQEKLEALAAEGKSASQIAKEMRCFGHLRDGGRNAVIGRAHRTGVQLAGRIAPGTRLNPKISVAVKAALAGEKVSAAARRFAVNEVSIRTRLLRIRKGELAAP